MCLALVRIIGGGGGGGGITSCSSSKRKAVLPTNLPTSVTVFGSNRQSRSRKVLLFSEMLIQQQRRHTHTHIHHRQQQTGEKAQYSTTAATAAKNCHQVEVVVMVAQVGSVNTSQCTALSCKRRVFFMSSLSWGEKEKERKQTLKEQTLLISKFASASKIGVKKLLNR